MKTTRHSSSALRDALPFVALSDIPAFHKSVLIEVVAQALKEIELEEQAHQSRVKNGPWDTTELELLTTQLNGRIAINWQHADEGVIGLAARLNRSPSEVKEKAKELGFGVGVDYRLARESAQREDG